ncbi:unnamed protein product [Strongylus vulgaris]|uniref:Uncharacterized protein n=1 Tax=Strongylus vulgaris TaxID=40348 RepID=A0A3P7J4Z0_STRVU|nr:unnamed protein product [Strongylus vulgaris]
MGQHLRVLRAFQARDKNFGKTAPTMTAEAAERWRSSYRKYRHQKHQEKTRDKNFGKTAPTMTAEAAERWRSSYRKYRHQKHQEKKAASERADSEKSKLPSDIKEKRKTFKQIKAVARGRSLDKHERRHKKKHASMDLDETP